METALVAIGLLGFIALVVIILMMVHKRDQKKDAAKNLHLKKDSWLQ